MSDISKMKKRKGIISDSNGIPIRKRKPNGQSYFTRTFKKVENKTIKEYEQLLEKNGQKVRALALCHGHKHKKLIWSSQLNIEHWYMIDRDNYCDPDMAIDLLKKDDVDRLPDDYFDHILFKNGPSPCIPIIFKLCVPKLKKGGYFHTTNMKGGLNIFRNYLGTDDVLALFGKTRDTNLSDYKNYNRLLGSLTKEQHIVLLKLATMFLGLEFIKIEEKYYPTLVTFKKE